MSTLTEQLRTLIAQAEALEAENAALREQLGQKPTPPERFVVNVKDETQLASAVSVEGAAVCMIADIELTHPVTLAKGVELFSDKELALRVDNGGRCTLKWANPSTDGARMIYTTGDNVIEDINFDTPGAGREKSQAATAIYLRGDNITIRNCHVVGDGVNYFIDGEGDPNIVIIEGCTSDSLTGIRGYFAWVSGSEWLIRKCRVANVTREHVVRISGCDGVVIEGCDFANLDRRDVDRLDTAKGTIVVQSGANATITGNILNGPAGVGPLGPPDGKVPEQRWRGLTWENNRQIGGFFVDAGAEDITIADNVIQHDGTTVIQIAGYDAKMRRGVELMYIQRNTLINNGDKGSAIFVQGKVTDVKVVANHAVMPNLKPAGYGTAVVYVQRPDLTGLSFTNNVWADAGKRAHRYDPNAVMNVGTGYDKGTLLTAAEWLALPQVFGDRFADAAPGSIEDVGAQVVTQ